MNQVLHLTPGEATRRLIPHILEMISQAHGRIAVGIAGGPGVGKSTLAAELATMINATHPGIAAVVPMDGFHMRHTKLEALGQTERKGAPHTFEGEAFVNFLHQLKTATETISGPAYSRKVEDVVENAFAVPPEVRLLIVEGNYLLLTEGPWAGIKPLLDYSVFINVPRERVEQRLLARHGAEGLFTEERNRAHVARNDLPNYDLVWTSRDRAEVIIELESES